MGFYTTWSNWFVHRSLRFGRQWSCVHQASSEKEGLTTVLDKKIEDFLFLVEHHWFYPLSVAYLPMASNRPIVQRIFRYNDKSESSFINGLIEFAKGKYRFEPLRFAIFRTVVALLSIGSLVAFGYNLVKQIKDEQFSTRSYTVVNPFDNAKKFGMVGMPSVLVYTNILGQPSFENVSVAYSFKLSAWRN